MFISSQFSFIESVNEFLCSCPRVENVIESTVDSLRTITAPSNLEYGVGNVEISPQASLHSLVYVTLQSQCQFVRHQRLCYERSKKTRTRNIQKLLQLSTATHARTLLHS